MFPNSVSPKAVPVHPIKKAAERLGYLYGRWQDEKQYEDFADYVASMKTCLPKDAVFLTMTKRPFQVTFTMAGKENLLKVRGNSVIHVKQP